MNPTRNDYVAPAVEVLEISGAESCCIAVSGENNQGSGEDMGSGGKPCVLRIDFL